MKHIYKVGDKVWYIGHYTLPDGRIRKTQAPAGYEKIIVVEGAPLPYLLSNYLWVSECDISSEAPE